MLTSVRGAFEPDDLPASRYLRGDGRAERDHGAVAQAVILAAGAGSRLRATPDEAPKPLTFVAGLSLLERAIIVFRDAGVSEVIVVVGFQRAALLASLSRLGASHRIRVTPAISAQWTLGNGASVLAAERYVRAPFFLAMCDHIFEPAFLQRLLDADDGERPCTVVVDRDVEGVRDVDEATKVRLNGDRVMAIGKSLSTYDAVDTGVFLCRSPLFEALRQAAANGGRTLSDGVRLLAQRGEVGAVDGTGLTWFDVDTADDLQHAETTLASLWLAHSQGPTEAFAARGSPAEAEVVNGIEP